MERMLPKVGVAALVPPMGNEIPSTTMIKLVPKAETSGKALPLALK